MEYALISLRTSREGDGISFHNFPNGKIEVRMRDGGRLFVITLPKSFVDKLAVILLTRKHFELDEETHLPNEQQVKRILEQVWKELFQAQT